MNTLAEALEAYEKRNGFTTSEASATAGIPRTTWYRFKTEPGLMPELKNAVKLASVLDLPITEIMRLSETLDATKKDPSTDE